MSTSGVGAIYLARGTKEHRNQLRAPIDRFCLILPCSFCPQRTRKDFIVIAVLINVIVISVVIFMQLSQN